MTYDGVGFSEPGGKGLADIVDRSVFRVGSSDYGVNILEEPKRVSYCESLERVGFVDCKAAAYDGR